jgi:L,D-transpeptidase ErfK/SrfK
MTAREIPYKTFLLTAFTILCLFMSAYAAEAKKIKARQSIEELILEIELLEGQTASLARENLGLRRILDSTRDNEIYFVVDTANNRMDVRQGNALLKSMIASTGSRVLLEHEDGRSWFFENPTGVLTVLAKERNPTWIRPDWSFVEENMPIPDIRHPSRFVPGVLGKYSLVLGNGFKVHGAMMSDLLGSPVTHGCVALSEADLEVAYRYAKVGTRIYFY